MRARDKRKRKNNSLHGQANSPRDESSRRLKNKEAQYSSWMAIIRALSWSVNQNTSTNLLRVSVNRTCSSSSCCQRSINSQPTRERRSSRELLCEVAKDQRESVEVDVERNGKFGRRKTRTHLAGLLRNEDQEREYPKSGSYWSNLEKQQETNSSHQSKRKRQR